MSIDDIGKILGAAGAGFAASWASLPGRVKKEIAEDESLALLRQRVDALQKDLGDARETIKRLEERTSRSVSDEEFGTYTAHTSAAVTALTEKIGHATGAIEAWYRSQDRR